MELYEKPSAEARYQHDCYRRGDFLIACERISQRMLKCIDRGKKRYCSRGTLSLVASSQNEVLPIALVPR